MLLLVTILLVAVGTISLIFGFVQSSLLPIYISIACSVLAAVVLLIFSRMTAKSQQVVTAGGPTPLDTGGRADRDDRTAPVPAFSGTGLIGDSSPGETFAPDDRYGSSSRYGAADDEQDEVDDIRPADTGVVDDDFPIERYDSRRVGEILPLLAELDLDELDIVREHEEQGKSRATVLARIDQLIDQLEAEDRQEAASRYDEPALAPAFAPAAAGMDEPGLDDDDDDLDEAPVPVAAAAPPLPTQAVTVAALPEDDGYFPIEDYDDLRASEILPLLPELDDDELVMVRDRERSTAARSSILRRIDALMLDAPESGAAREPQATFAPEPAPAPVPAVEVPAKKAPSPRAPAKKTPASKAPAKKAAVAPPPKKAPVVKKAAAPRKSAATQATTPAKKVPAKAAGKATAKKAPAEKVATGRAAAASKGGGTASAKAAKVTKAARKTSKG